MILGLIKRNSGPGFHRIHMPLLLMHDTNVFITNNASPELFEEKQPTTIYYNRDISDDILALQSKYQFKIAVDVDDYWELDARHILYNYHYTNRVNEHYIKHIRLADVVTTTHERLAELIYPINRNVVVVPNAIPTHSYFPRMRMPSANGLRRVFWQGSVTHGPDLELLRGPMKRLDKNKFAAVIAGYAGGDDAQEWDKMVDAFTNGLRLKGMVLPGSGVMEYYKNYAYADVCVAPLRESLFNSMKSNLKILEAAHMGLPVIASNVHPYKDIPGVMYVNKQSDWYDYLNSSSRELKINAGLLRQWAHDNHDFDTINEIRKNAIL